MSTYPFAIDDDSTIIRIDDNISEMGGEASNQLRDAVFAIQSELGINPAGSAGTLATRLNVSINPNGTLKTSALTSVGLVTLPIDDAQVGSGAGIKEFKLDLDHSTSDLHTLILANSALINSLTTFTSTTASDLATHIAGGALLTSGAPARHVASHIDLNVVPLDPRDPAFVWSGLLDKDGALRPGTTVASALFEINTDFVNHQNAIADAHEASAVNIDVDDFQEIPQTVNTVQKLADHLDDFEVITVTEHRATQHANAIPKVARSQSCTLSDGYKENVVPPTPCSTFLVRAPNTMPVDDISAGDDIVSFVPDNAGFVFDSQFSQVRVGDVIRINYANGVEASFPIDSIRYVPGTEWIVRLNGVNLADSDGYALARIDRPLFDRDTAGILAVAAANATPTGSFDTILSSLVVGHPRGAMALGLGFDPGQLDASHFNLHLELYPTGNPNDRVISMPAVDVTGNLGTTPGQYTLENVVQSINNRFREIGFNFRFIAFAHDGNLGIMLADTINCVSFAIVKGVNSSGTLTTGTFTNNVIGESAGDTFDAFGFGADHIDIAGPTFISSFTDATAAQLPTKVIVPLKRRNYIVNGRKRDDFADTWQANEDGYWDGYISARTTIGAFTVETTYTVILDLKAAGLKPGKTIVIQPAIPFSDGLYNDVDYGRFIIKSVSFFSCPGQPDACQITVINGLHSFGAGFGFSSSPSLPVRLHFSEDSVAFNNEHVINQTPTALDYRRLHEVFINDEGKTFSHERARLPVQVESTTLLRTAEWHAEDVAPKLRGYRDNATTFNRFIRFYILSYDTTTGEYDGYIGQRNPSGIGILSPGPVTTGRKNVPTKFYDETHVDFIELNFVETSPASPGIAILSDGTPGGGGVPRFVDIEVFESLQTHDELLLLATAEAHWDPGPGEDIVQHVVNRRQFGSIDEEDFTNSAIDFITAGDRHLHANGIIRGFDLDFINPADDREIFFKGGVALVNGKILTVNNLSVTIPEISEDGTGLPDLIDWAVCVNDDGELEPIIITPTKQQFFAIENTGGATYYVPSVTFAELLSTRKDLTPIVVVTATIASITIAAGDVDDVRRFVVAESLAQPSVLAPIGFGAGNFQSFSTVKNWANALLPGSPIVVKVKGEFDIDTSVDLTGLSQKVIFEGDNAVVNIIANQGLLIDGNIEFRNITFNYDPTITTFVLNDKINSANGCIFGTGSISDVAVVDCRFNSTVNRQRPPFIGFEINMEDVVQNIKISGNTFDDSGGAIAEFMSAFAITSLNDAVGLTEPAIVYNIRIEDNVCNQKQGIFILQESDDVIPFVSAISGPGIRAYDAIISGNNCGAIGFLITSIDTTDPIATTADRVGGLIVKDNFCNIISHMANFTFATAVIPGTIAINGLQLVSPFPAGSVDIHNNNCNTINIGATDHDISGDNFTRISIESNRVTATDPTILNNWRTGFFGGADQTAGISVSDSVDDNGDVIISNNVLTSGLIDSTVRRFVIGIQSFTSSNITGNIVRGLAAAGIGIAAVGLSLTPDFARFIVSNNQIHREGRPISRYIALETDNTLGGGLCIDNFFDDFTNGADVETINADHANTWIVERNKNHTVTASFRGSIGDKSINDYTVGDLAGTPSISSVVLIPNNATQEVVFDYFDASNVRTFAWHIGGQGELPQGVTIVSVAITHRLTSGVPNQLNNLQVTLADDSGAEFLNDTPSAASQTATLTLVGAFINSLTNRLNAVVRWQVDDAAFTRRLLIEDFEITYRW